MKIQFPVGLGGDPVSIEAIELASRGNAVLGIRDSGKTYTATWLAERFLENNVPIIAFDPIGVWRYLKVPATHAKGKGFEVVVAGGECPDVPLQPESAAKIVEAAINEGVSLVIDLYSLELSKADWKRIVEDSVRTLLYRNKGHALRHVFIEEAAEFIPQRVGPDSGRVYAEMEKLGRMGGNASLGFTLINQRSEEVNKAVLELCDCLFLHRQKGRNSLTALTKWLDFSSGDGRLIADQLPMLPSGECFLWAGQTDKPAHIKVPVKRSLHPDRRNPDLKKLTLASVDVGAFITKLTPAIEKVIADAKENDPAELKRRIRELEKAKKDVEAPKPDPKSEAARQSLLIAVQDMRNSAQFIDEALPKLHERLAAMERISRELRETADKVFAATHKPDQLDRLRDRMVTKITPAQFVEMGNHELKVSKKLKESGLTVTLDGPQRQMLKTLAWWKSVGHEAPTKAQVAAVTGWRVTSGHIKNVSGSLRSAGLIEYPAAGCISMTDAGRQVIGDDNSPLEFRSQIMSFLDGPQKQVFCALEQLGSPITRSKLCEMVGWNDTSGHVKNVLGSMRSLELIDYPKPGEVFLQRWVVEQL